MCFCVTLYKGLTKTAILFDRGGRGSKNFQFVCYRMMVALVKIGREAIN